MSPGAIAKLGLKGDEKVLDIGSGDGKVTAEIASHLPQGSAIGIDSSEEMVRFARENFPTTAFRNLRFEVMDARDISSGPSERFNAVFSNATLHCILDHIPVLNGIRRSLKRGGRALLQMGGRGNVAEVLEVMDSVMEKEGWKRYFGKFAFPYGFYGPEEYGVRLILIPRLLLLFPQPG